MIIRIWMIITGFFMVTGVSEKGLATLTYLEGCPLRAYRDASGVWTIGAGLTAASGVVVPRAGMVISQQQADALLEKALAKNYVPAVLKVMGSDQPQHVIDGCVSFHFNTGAIGRASWVKSFLKGNFTAARTGLLAWRKAGGKVLAGLVKRREIEADMILKGVYPALAEKIKPPRFTDLYARFVVPSSQEDVGRIGDELEVLGYMVKDGFRLRKAGIEQFQRDHNLTIDGLIGKATLAALQREMEARSRSKLTVQTGAGGGVVGACDEITGLLDGWALLMGATVLGVSLVFMVWLMWHYRDVVAVKVRPYLPRLAKWLWSW